MFPHSPRKVGVGMLQNFMSLDSPDSDARSSRIALKDELVKKLEFDDPRVFGRLALDRIPAQFVTSCAQAFKEDQELLDARRSLESITAAAIGKPLEELEADDEVQDSHGIIRKVKRKAEEKKMYKPLASIFHHVENFQDSSNTHFKHTFESTDSTVLKSDASTWGFPKGSPDFVMSERSSLSPVRSGRKPVFWRQIQGFCEVKPTPEQGPKSTDPKVVKAVVCQAADYARLHLSARPFQLFSVGLLIFGSKFCVAIFDRSGVLFSPIHDMWDGIEIFIRVIRSLTCHLSSVELGQDPTVTILSDQQHEIWREKTTALGRDAPKDFPTFVVTNGSHSWYTIGLPIWTSVSLFGRGTCVWLVQDNDNGTGPVLVLKNTWRSASRLSESMIYGSIDGHHPALATLHRGQDVLFPGEQRCITTRSLRGLSPDDKIEGGEVLLHRLLLESRGRPLWEYRSEKELLQGIRAALSAHQFLCEQGILHRDISAGNIMLPARTPPEPGAEGILLDLEFSRIKRTSLDTTRHIVVPPVRTPSGGMTDPTVRSHTIFGPDVMRGAAMTGTAQFMAEDILEAILTGAPIEHEPRHDIESFIHVLGYSVTRKAVLESRALDADTRKKLHLFFYSTFGRMKLDDIWMSRRARGPLTIRQRFPDLVSDTMAELMGKLDTWLKQSTLPAEFYPKPLTHEYVLSQLDEAIAKAV